MLDEEKGAYGPEEDVGRLEEVAGPNALGLVTEEGRPGLSSRSWRSSSPQILLVGALGHADA